MRKINEIIVHCTATPEGRHVTVADVDCWHRARKFNGIGYHYLIYLDGTIHEGRPIERIGAHCKQGGHNRYSIGVCYVGGLAKDGKTTKDTRTPEQKEALAKLLAELHQRFPSATLHGHREFVCLRKQKDASISCADCLRQYKACKFAAKTCSSFDCHEYDYIFNQQKKIVPMKKLLFFLLLSCTALLLSCKATKASVSAAEKSETVATSAYRLCSSLTTDSISQRLTLSVDSMIILFAQPYSQLQSGMPFIIAAQESTSLRDAGAASLDDMYFLGNKPPAAKDGKSIPSGNKQHTAQQPSAISIYGLHIDAGDNKKSIVQASAKDSMAETRQSYHAGEKNVRKAAPSSAPKYIFYILLIGIAIWIYHKLRS